MTLNEASERFHISADRLREYEANSLLDNAKYSGDISYCSEEFARRIYLINLLLKSGMDMEGLKKYLRMLDEKPEIGEEHIRILRKQRCNLLLLSDKWLQCFPDAFVCDV